MIRAGELRHHVNVLLPPQGQDKHGEPQGNPTVVVENWPCSISQLRGNELEQARQVLATATHEIKGYIDPQRPITAEHYLQFGTRKFEIGDAEDVGERGVEYRLICGEFK